MTSCPGILCSLSAAANCWWSSLSWLLHLGVSPCCSPAVFFGFGDSEQAGGTLHSFAWHMHCLYHLWIQGCQQKLSDISSSYCGLLFIALMYKYLESSNAVAKSFKKSPITTWSFKIWNGAFQSRCQTWLQSIWKHSCLSSFQESAKSTIVGRTGKEVDSEQNRKIDIQIGVCLSCYNSQSSSACTWFIKTFRVKLIPKPGG